MTALTRSALEDAFKKEDNLKKKAEEVASDLTKGTYDISAFVEELGFALTSSDINERVSGTQLLSSTLAQVPTDLLKETQLDFLSTFYADRLKDHHHVIPAVIDGMDALIRMKHLPKQNVTTLLQSFFQHTNCQSQTRSDRAKLFIIFKYLTERYEEALKSMGGDFIYGLINSIDGERDPRNLDFIFSFMPSFIAHYPLLHLSEEMYEIFACYFPIDFNPSKTDPDVITRDELADKLTQCLVATPDFVEWTVSLALEKLDSDLVVAKLDSLHLLHQAALKFPPKTLELHFEQIWGALKIEIFPGSDNSEVVGVGLRTLGALLEQAATTADISHNYQSVVLGNILPHLSEVNQRLFYPATAIALACIAADAAYASEKVLNSFLYKLKASKEQQDDELLIKIYGIVAQIYKISSMRCGADLTSKLSGATSEELLTNVIATLRRNENGEVGQENADLMRAALCVLTEAAPLITAPQRALIYKALVQLLTQESIDLEFSELLERLGALQPIELQSNYLDVCIRNFPLYSNFVKRKVYKNVLPLIKQMAFSERILGLIMKNIFAAEQSEDSRLLALEALNALLREEEANFIEELQQNSCLIEKLINLAKEQQAKQQQPPTDYKVLEQISVALSLNMQHLAIAEQYAIATEYLPQLNLQLSADLFIAKGLLGYLHKDISLDDHFERLVHDLTQLSLNCEEVQLRQVAHHLLCSLINKIADTPQNRSTFAAAIAHLKAEIKKDNAKAVEVLAWLGKGLIVRGYEEAGDIIEALSELLDHPSLSTGAGLAFEIISAEYPQLHLPIVKFLFKQKFFHMVLTKLGHKLTTYCEHHLNAFMYVLKDTPHAVLKMNIEKIGPLLFKALESNQLHTLHISLQICEHFIKQEDEYFCIHLQHIIPCVLQLSTFKTAMQVRVAALELLHDITKYPTFVLLPYKVDVVLQLALALDDPKRIVRTAAVRARNAWFLVGVADGTENP